MSKDLAQQRLGAAYGKIRLGKIVYNIDGVEFIKLPSAKTIMAKADYILYGTSNIGKVEGKLVFTTTPCLTMSEAARELMAEIDQFKEAQNETP